MAIFARFNGLTSMKHTSTLIALTIGLMTAASATHAEKYCKSVDQNGNASYTLAPATGCKKQFKTVGVRQFRAVAATESTAIPSTATNTSPTTTATNAANSAANAANNAANAASAAITASETPAVNRSQAAKRNPENQ